MKKILLFSMVLLTISFAQATVVWEEDMSSLAGWEEGSNATNEPGETTGGIRVVNGTLVQLNSWWDNAGWTEMSKDTGVVIENNTDYTLTVRVENYADGSVLLRILDATDSPWTTIAEASLTITGGWADYTLSFSTTGGQNASHVGHKIGVDFIPNWWDNVGVDNIKIDARSSIAASNPSPANDLNVNDDINEAGVPGDTKVDVQLGWNTGFGPDNINPNPNITKHYLYIRENNPDMVSVTPIIIESGYPTVNPTASYLAEALNFASVYYWRVDESVNNALPSTTDPDYIIGPVWAFETVQANPISAPRRALPVRYGLELHLAADKITGLSDGQIVSSWPDASGKGRNAAQSTDSLMPIYKTNILNGLPAVRFDGTDDTMSFTSITTIRTAFFVIKEDADATANNRCILGHSSAKYFHRGSPKQIWSSPYTEPEVLDGVTKINGTVIDGLSTDVPTDFAIISVATTAAVSASQLTKDRNFSDRVWDGDIAEVILYSRILTPREEKEVGAYLKGKYALAADYPPSEEASYVPTKPGTYNIETANPSPLVITMNLQNVQQKIQSFGASDCWSAQYVGNWPEAKTEGIADLLFSAETESNGQPKGIGLSLWRMNFGAGSARQGNIYDHWRRTDFFLKDTFTGYDWTRCSGQRNFLQLAKARGVEQFLGFFNSPPITMTKNGHAFCDPSVGSTNLDPDKRDDFAGYIANVLRHFRDEEGIDFTYISPVNEPQWEWTEDASNPGYAWQEGCRYNNTDITPLVGQIAISLASYGLQTDILVAEAGAIDYIYGNNTTTGYQADRFYSTSYPTTYVGDLTAGAINAHSYWTDTPSSGLVSTRQSLRTKLDQYGLGYVQSEYCILGDRGEIIGNGRDLGIDPALFMSRTIHNDLVVANAESWQWWLGISPSDYKDGLVYTDYNDTDGNYYQSKMLWAMGNFSRFIRPGMYRIELQRSDNKTHSEAATDIMVSGYYSFTHNVAVVVFVNYTTSVKPVKLQFSSFPSGKPIDYLIPYITAANSLPASNLTPCKELASDAVFNIPARSVVTIVGHAAIIGDIDLDRDVDENDLIAIVQHWLDEDCSDCGRADINISGGVDLADWAMFAQHWLEGT